MGLSMFKRTVSIFAALGLALSLGACSQNEKAAEPDYADEEGMSVIGQGLSK